MVNIKVAFQGMKGAYSQQAVNEFAKKYTLDFKSHSTKNFRALFEAINNETYIGIVPIENSTAGSVTQCHDLFLEYDFEIIGEHNLEVNHCLLAKKETKIQDIKEVFSHPQALSQCSKFIEKNDIVPVSYLDTAGSAEFVCKTDRLDVASISSEFAANIYGLEILKKTIQNNGKNITRFLLVKKRGIEFDFEKNLPKPDKCTVIFEGRDIPASLYKCIGGFATNNINLTKIESRPSKNENFNYSAPQKFFRFFHMQFKV